MKLDFSNNRVNYLYYISETQSWSNYIRFEPKNRMYAYKRRWRNRWFTKCKKGYCRDRNLLWEYDGEDDPNKHDLYKDL